MTRFRDGDGGRVADACFVSRRVKGERAPIITVFTIKSAVRHVAGGNKDDAFFCSHGAYLTFRDDARTSVSVYNHIQHMTAYFKEKRRRVKRKSYAWGVARGLVDISLFSDTRGRMWAECAVQKYVRVVEEAQTGDFQFFRLCMRDGVLVFEVLFRPWPGRQRDGKFGCVVGLLYHVECLGDDVLAFSCGNSFTGRLDYPASRINRIVVAVPLRCLLVLLLLRG